MSSFTTIRNHASVEIAEGERLYVGRQWLRSRIRDQDLFPSFWRGFLPDAFFARLFAGRLFDPYIQSTSPTCRIDLVGTDPKGTFVACEVGADQAFFVRLRHVAAYKFGEGGHFGVNWRPWDIARWISGMVSAVVVHGPASIFFYGPDLSKALTTEEYDCRSDLVVAFDAKATFALGAEKDGGVGWLAPIMTTTSGNVYMGFEPGTQIVQAIGAPAHRGRLARAPRIIFGLLLGAYLVEPYLIEPILLRLVAE